MDAKLFSGKELAIVVCLIVGHLINNTRCIGSCDGQTVVSK